MHYLGTVTSVLGVRWDVTYTNVTVQECRSLELLWYSGILATRSDPYREGV